MLITPEYVFKDVTHITPEWLAAKGITALVLDIDNTLTADRSQELPEEVAAWLDTMRKAGVKLTIVSNGAEKREMCIRDRLCGTGAGAGYAAVGSKRLGGGAGRSGKPQLYRAHAGNAGKGKSGRCAVSVSYTHLAVRWCST